MGVSYMHSTSGFVVWCGPS